MARPLRITSSVVTKMGEPETGERQDAERHHEADRGGAVPYQWMPPCHTYWESKGIGGSLREKGGTENRR
jgi:hypothetical protein